MEYETPNPGPCSGCGTRIWQSGGLCSDCSESRNIARTKRDIEHKELQQLRKENKSLKARMASLVRQRDKAIEVVRSLVDKVGDLKPRPGKLCLYGDDDISTCLSEESWPPCCLCRARAALAEIEKEEASVKT